MKVRALIIEDELPARVTINSYLKKYFPDIQVIAELDNTLDAKKFIDENEFEIIFLDVHLRDGKAIHIFEHVKNKNYRIVFTTAFGDYALEAFKIKAFGYLMKPIAPAEFKDILTRVLKDIGITVHPGKQIKIPISKGFKWINSLDIVRCESESNYTVIHLSDGSFYTVSKTLKLTESEFEGLGFIRIHQSHLINIRYLKDTTILNNYITLITGESFPISRAKRDSFLKFVSS